MKKCPKCHKNIPSNAKVCPYCGTPQSGYQPMKRTPKRKYAFIYSILIIALVFLPMGISYFFAFNALSDSGINQTATLKTYTKSNQETVVYQYDSLKEFQKFEQENGQKMLEGGISKYGTYFCDMEGKQIPLVKINNENYEIGKKEIDSVMYEGFSNEYLDKNEKDFWSFKFPKNFGKGTTLRMYDLIKRKLFQQKMKLKY